MEREESEMVGKERSRKSKNERKQNKSRMKIWIEEKEWSWNERKGRLENRVGNGK